MGVFCAENIQKIEVEMKKLFMQTYALAAIS